MTKPDWKAATQELFVLATVQLLEYHPRGRVLCFWVCIKDNKEL
jgi:hypothetical protein